MSAIHLDIDGAVATLRLDNPTKLNALTKAMMDDLESHCARLEREPAVLAVIVAAVPAKAFCAGADIKEWAELSPTEFARLWVREGHRVFDRLARLSKPTIAAVSGHAMGGGLELAAACDIRVMAPAAMMALPEAQVGVVPGWSGTQRLTRLLPESVVKEMALFGTRLTAERAYTLGFVAELAEDPEAAARLFAENMTRLSPRALEIAKYQIHAAVDEDSSAMIETLGSGMIGATQDRAEGVDAFKEKRQPIFPGL